MTDRKLKSPVASAKSKRAPRAARVHQGESNSHLGGTPIWSLWRAPRYATTSDRNSVAGRVADIHHSQRPAHRRRERVRFSVTGAQDRDRSPATISTRARAMPQHTAGSKAHVAAIGAGATGQSRTFAPRLASVYGLDLAPIVRGREADRPASRQCQGRRRPDRHHLRVRNVRLRSIDNGRFAAHMSLSISLMAASTAPASIAVTSNARARISPASSRS